ncbi:hypothetical protein [Acidithiobacillus sp.]|jgi:hypothetical protein|nr:hypothetical protein [Acidithiobacillus sp.]
MGAVIANWLFFSHKTVSITHQNGISQAFASHQGSAPRGKHL